MQNVPLCTATRTVLQIFRADQNGGYRTVAAASDCDAVLQPIPSVRDLIADYVLFVDLEVLPSEWYVIAGYGWLPMMSG